METRVWKGVVRILIMSKGVTKIFKFRANIGCVRVSRGV